MIHFYVAETSEGFDSIKLEVALSDGLKMIFPEVLNGKPRTELEIKRYLTDIFDEKNLNQIKDKIAVIYSTSEIVFDFFRILIIAKKLAPEDFKLTFVNEKLQKAEFDLDRDARFYWPTGLFSIHDQNLETMLFGGSR